MATGGSDQEKSSLTEGAGRGMRLVMSAMGSKFSSVKHVSTTEVEQWLNSGDGDVVVLDCREPREYDVSHLPDSTRVDWKRFDVDQLLTSVLKPEGPTNKKIVCYCSLGFRSGSVAKKIQEYLHKKEDPPPAEVYCLAGSIFKWANEGRPMVDNSGEKTSFAHPHIFLICGLLNKPVRKW